MYFIHLNARSLLPKMVELRIIASKSKASVITVSETWIENSVTDSEISIKGHHNLRKDRNRSGCEVCVSIRSYIAFARRTDTENDNLESLWLELYLPKPNLLLLEIAIVHLPTKLLLKTTGKKIYVNYAPIGKLSFLVILISVKPGKGIHYTNLIWMF